MTPVSTQNIVMSLSHEGQQQVKGFKFFWLQYVRGFNAANHCKKCLIGHTSEQFKFRAAHKLGDYNLNEADSDYLYLCGVAEGWNWDSNLHVPIRPKPGAGFEVAAYTGMIIRVLNGELMEIPPLEDNWMGLGKSYTTCRNFQFAVEYYGRQQVVDYLEKRRLGARQNRLNKLAGGNDDR